MRGLYLLLQLTPDLGLHLPSAHSLWRRGDDSSPDSHMAFKSVQRQVRLFDGSFKVLHSCAVGEGVLRGLGWVNIR